MKKRAAAPSPIPPILASVAAVAVVDGAADAEGPSVEVNKVSVTTAITELLETDTDIELLTEIDELIEIETE